MRSAFPRNDRETTAAVVKATGHEWGWWLDRLNRAGSRHCEHREITRFVEETFDISSWWVQSVAVGYERLVGLREIGQRREGSYDANKSKTLPGAPMRGRNLIFEISSDLEAYSSDWPPPIRPASLLL